MLKQWSNISKVISIANKWEDGNLFLEPKDPSLSSKKIPIDAFFHKIVMVRDKIRVMEQKINPSKLPDFMAV